MKTKISLWINSALFAGAALWFLVIPAVELIGDVRDPALAQGGIPRCVFAWHRHLAPAFARWAKGTMAGDKGAHVGQYDIKGTEWPAHSAMLFLLATESLQKAWERNQSLSPVAPKVYAREAIDASAALLMDPVNATWVRNFWGDGSYLKSEDIFFRMMVINGLTAHLSLTGDRKYADFLRAQADSLAAELDASPHGLLEDYPGQTYPVDIVPAIAGIQRIDRLLGTDHAAMIARAERLMEGRVLDPATGLPGYFVDMHTAEPLQPSRGIGNSMTLVWTPQLWPEKSPQWYASHVKYFWQQDWLLAGFREFARKTREELLLDGLKSRKPLWPAESEWQDEVDAGPVIAGYGTSASALGIGAANGAGDFARARLMAMEAIAAAWPLPNGALPGARVLSTPDAPYTGVTALLFALTREAQRPQPPSSITLTGGGLENTVNIPAVVASPTAPALTSNRTPGFVILFIGGGLAIGLLVLLTNARRIARPHREIGSAEFVAWAVLMLAGAALWFIHPGWSVVAWLVAQWWPRPAKRARQRVALASAAEAGAV